jgi:hypothetical protein
MRALSGLAPRLQIDSKDIVPTTRPGSSSRRPQDEERRGKSIRGRSFRRDRRRAELSPHRDSGLWVQDFPGTLGVAAGGCGDIPQDQFELGTVPMGGIRHGDPPARLAGRGADRQHLPPGVEKRDVDPFSRQHGGRPVEGEAFPDPTEIHPRPGGNFYRAGARIQRDVPPFPAAPRAGGRRGFAGGEPEPSREGFQRGVERAVREARVMHGSFQRIEEIGTYRDRTAACAGVEKGELAVFLPVAEHLLEVFHFVQSGLQRFPHVPGISACGRLEAKDGSHEITRPGHRLLRAGVRPPRRGKNQEDERQQNPARGMPGRGFPGSFLLHHATAAPWAIRRSGSGKQGAVPGVHSSAADLKIATQSQFGAGSLASHSGPVKRAGSMAPVAELG